LCRSILNLAFTSFLVIQQYGCASTEPTRNGIDAAQLTGSQAKSYISGKTEIWTEDSEYEIVSYTFSYHPDGIIEVYREGETLSGDWDVSDDGLVCYQIPQSEKYCYYYINVNGTIKRKLVNSAR